MPISTSSILGLYKSLYRYGQHLKYTDKSYYYDYIRNQFQSVAKENPQTIETLYKVGDSKNFFYYFYEDCFFCIAHYFFLI